MNVRELANFAASNGWLDEDVDIVLLAMDSTMRGKSICGRCSKYIHGNCTLCGAKVYLHQEVCVAEELQPKTK